MPDAATTADWISAVGTVLAAGGTVGALIYAAKASKAASKSADVANRAVQNETLPLLLDVPHEHYTDYEHEFPWPLEHEDGTSKTPMRGQIGLDPASGTFSVPVRNVGRGVARIEEYAISLNRTGERFLMLSDQSIPVGEDLWLAGKPDDTNAFRVALQHTPSPLHVSAPLNFSVTYTDNAGTQSQILEMGLGSKGRESAWRVLNSSSHRLDGLQDVRG